MLLAHSADSPMQIGGLIQYERPSGADGAFAAAARAHLAQRIPATALSSRLVANPGSYDTDAWFGLASPVLDDVVAVVDHGGSMDTRELYELVAGEAMRPLDLDGRPPFRILLIDRINGGRAAMFLQVHHGFADGIGFQSIVQALSDPTPEPVARPPRYDVDEVVPDEATWRAASDIRFAAEAAARDAIDRDAAKAALAAFVADGHAPAISPDLGDLSAPTSKARSYDALTVSLPRVRSIGRILDGTVNDVFLMICGSAVRALMLETGRPLPDLPAVALGSRSYRKPEHGDLGNYIIPIRPTLGTDIADTRERFDAIRAAARVERRRSELLEPLITATADGPFKSRDRRARHAQAGGGNDPRIGSSVTLSNVPGPDGPLYLAGCLELSNHPAPFLGTGKFLNVTLRRYRDELDLGVMTDAAKVAEASTISQLIVGALDELAALAGVD